jgi:hypothetical protein
MRGGRLHSDVLARGLRDALERLGARVWTEYPVRPGRGAGALDLYAELNGKRLAIEVELGVRRVLQDVRKAEAIGVDALVVVTPTPKVAALARRRLGTQTRSRVRVHVLPFGRALAFLSHVFGVDSRQDTKSQSGSSTTASRKHKVG